MKKKLKVIELFAGVGGFRLGLEGDKNGNSSTSGYTEKLNSIFKVVWSNQFEPSTPTKQWASDIYINQFGKENHSNDDLVEISKKPAKLIKKELPDCDVLVGGFPCQDYSVANSLRTAKGLLGKKGVLWYAIEGILDKLGRKKPKYLILENVDRLLKSPANQRGKDFAIMLASLNNLGYVVEWRVINAADFGFPQKRRRVFILAYLGKKNKNIFDNEFDAIEKKKEDFFSISNNLKEISKDFGKGDKVSKFLNSGFCVNGNITTKSLVYQSPKKTTLLKNILVPESKVGEEFWIVKNDLGAWKKGKEGGTKERTSYRDGKPHPYKYSEGSMKFPDDLNSPSRTIITSEGGKYPSRFKHIIDPKNDEKYRRLTPVELERLNMFPDDHTKFEGITNSKRAFLMGNALVVGVVERIGLCIMKYEDEENKKK